jgi:glutathione peroxidase
MLDLGFDKLGGGRLTGPTGFGKPTLVVNTASECGFTPQYAELQQLWEKYRERGLVVLGVPCNDFGKQEPGDAGQIGAFCRKNYGVTFPLTAKAEILGANARHPFYKAVAQALGEDQLPRWNFHKFLVGADGELLGGWPSKVSPLAREITDAIEEALA